MVEFDNITEETIGLVAKEFYYSNLFVKSNEYDNINKLSNNINSYIEFGINRVWIVCS